MKASVTRLPLLAAIVAAAAAGCAPSSSSTAAGASSPAQTPASALAAVRLAAKVTADVNSFTGTLAMKGTVSSGTASAAGVSGGLSMTATFAEQLHPTLLLSADVGSYSMLGMSVPGGITELLTSTAMYLKAPYLTQQLHLTRPWIAIPLSAASKSSGIDITQLISQATGSGPLTQAQLLGASSSVREAGTGTFDGVPVTEYTGTVSVAKAIGALSGSAKAQLQQMDTTAGLTGETYTVWIDGQHVMRKAVITGTGATMTETVTMTITSVNQPVSIVPPPASQTTKLPGS